MKNKLLAGICVILVLAALAGCKTESEETPPALDWSKITGYDSEDGDLVLGTAAAALVGTNGRYKETVLGNFVMDGIAEYARHATGGTIDLALHNGQNLRVPEGGSLPAGELTNTVILGLIGNDKLFVSTFTGRQVKDVIEGYVKSATAGTWSGNCAVMVSKEVSYTIDTSTNPPEAKNIKVNGADIDEAKDYKIAVGEFIGNNTNESRTFLPILPDDKKTNYETLLKEALAMYVLAKGTVNPSDYPLGRYIGEVPVIPQP
jgi:2',3'-cyclic-nucleotide 2'-phosphodiesterase (5'-nucleotidase family)